MQILSPLVEIHDDVFWSLQFSGERIAVLRHTINETGTTGFLERRLDDEMARARRLAGFSAILFRLIPFEGEFRQTMQTILSAERQRDIEIRRGTLTRNG